MGSAAASADREVQSWCDIALYNEADEAPYHDSWTDASTEDSQDALTYKWEQEQKDAVEQSARDFMHSSGDQSVKSIGRFKGDFHQWSVECFQMQPWSMKIGVEGTVEIAKELWEKDLKAPSHSSAAATMKLSGPCQPAAVA